jgi:ribonuclease HI
MISQLHVYTDGSSVMGKYGGYACMFLDTGEIMSGRCMATNQLAEMLAIELAFIFAPENCKLIIYSDSMFAINAIHNRWNLTNSKHLLEVRNRIDNSSISKHISYKFTKVAGHSSDKYNRMVDSAAQKEARILNSEMS